MAKPNGAIQTHSRGLRWVARREFARNHQGMGSRGLEHTDRQVCGWPRPFAMEGSGDSRGDLESHRGEYAGEGVEKRLWTIAYITHEITLLEQEL